MNHKMHTTMKICILLSCGVLYIILLYLSKMELTCSNEVYLYNDGNSYYFYTQNENTYESGQQVSIRADGDSSKTSVEVLKLEKSMININGKNMYRCFLDNAHNKIVLKEGNCIIFSKYKSFLQYVIAKNGINSK